MYLGGSVDVSVVECFVRFMKKIEYQEFRDILIRQAGSGAGWIGWHGDSLSSIDPLSENYIGHTAACELGVSCCCDRSVIDCPWHGR
jgi:hypothetical protein